MGDPIVSTTSPGKTTRLIAFVSLGLVTLIAATASYLHALTVVQVADGPTIVSFFIPSMADLVIASGSANLVYASRVGIPLPKLSMLSVGLGVVVTLGANLAAGSPHDVPPWLVNAWPAVAFVLSLESLVGFGRRSLAAAEQAVTQAAQVCPHTIGATLAQAVVAHLDHARECLSEDLSMRELGRRFDVHHATVAKLVEQGRAEVAAAAESDVEDTPELSVAATG